MNNYRTIIRAIFALGLISTSAHAVSLTDLQFNINIERNTTPGAEAWLVFPQLESSDSTDLYTVAASPNQSFEGFLNHPMDYSSSSINYTSFEDIVSEMNGVWTITFGQDTENPEVLTFTVDASYLTSEMFPAVSILSPTPGSTVDGENFQATWSGPQNYSDENIYISGGDSYYQSYEGATTTESALITLDPGEKQLAVTYNYRGADDIFISIPEYGEQVLSFAVPNDALQSTYENWTSSSDYTVLSRVDFTVIPEPSTIAFGASVALFGLILIRRRNASTRNR